MTEKPTIFFHKGQVDPRNARSSHIQSQADEYQAVEASALGVLLLSGSQSPYGQRFEPIQNDPFAGKHGKAIVAKLLGPDETVLWGGSHREIFPEWLPVPIGITPNGSFGNNLTKKSLRVPIRRQTWLPLPKMRGKGTMRTTAAI